MHYSDLGLFIGLTTFPITKKIEDFYENEILDIFQTYKEDLDRHISNTPTSYKKEKRIVEICYRPAAYYIFGKFDLAIVSIIDDYEFCGKAFRPFNELQSKQSKKEGKQKKNSPFDYKIMAGVKASNEDSKSNLTDFSKNTFLAGAKYGLNDERRLPLISISNLKFSNILLLSEGYLTLNKFLLEYFNDKISEYCSKEGIEINGEIIESFGATENSILLFSNSYESLTKLILGIREIKFEDVIKNEKHHLSNVNLFEYSDSIFGFDFEILKYNISNFSENLDLSDSFHNIKLNEKISLNTRWSIKPGYLKTFKKHLNKRFENHDLTKDIERFRVAVGSGDIIPNTRDYLTVDQALNLLMLQYKIIESGEVDEDFIIESRSSPILNIDPFEEESSRKILSDEDLYGRYKTNWILDETEINNIIVKLKELGVAKVIRNKVAKTISNYNNVISDKVLFIYFLDLTNILKFKILESLEGYKPNEVFVRNNILRSTFLHIENAYYNRFFQSATNKEVTDFNTEYFGAVHQTISAFNNAYKVYNTLFEGTNSSNVVVIGSYPRIESTKNFLRINYFHVFQPEIFAAICCHESCNFFFDKSNIKKDIEPLYGYEISHLFRKIGLSYEQLGTSSKNHKYKNSDLVKTILSELKKEVQFSRYEHLIKILLKPKSQLLKYFIKDIITLKAGYADDDQLFDLWHWTYVSQMSANYQDNENIREDKFLIFLVRMMFVLTHDNANIKYQGKILAPNRSFQYLWSKYHNFCHWFVKSILKIDLVFDFKQKAERFAKQISAFNSLSIEDQITYRDSIKKCRVGVSPSQANKNMNSLRKELEDKYDIIFGELKNDLSKQIIEKLRSGSLYEFNNNQSDFFKTTSIFYSFLKFFDENIWEHKKPYQNEVLLRKSGKPQTSIFSEDDTPPKLLIDREGGLFCFCQGTRRQLFILRTAFIKTLWSLSLENKKKEFFKDLGNIDNKKKA